MLFRSGRDPQGKAAAGDGPGRPGGVPGDPPGPRKPHLLGQRRADRQQRGAVHRRPAGVHPHGLLRRGRGLKQEAEGVRPKVIVNPLGEWTGGSDVDSGATNRKLGSDMAQSVTGGGLHGKDLSKADVSVNIYAFLKAQETGETVELCCAIGDDTIDGKPYEEIVEIARKYIESIGGFEKFAEWGLF